MTKPLRVLVVDDSAYNRRTLTEMLTTLGDVEVVGKAGDGDEALRYTVELEPDLITLDLEMPRMDGFTFLRLLMAKRPTPVIVISGYSAKENVFRALELGALDFVPKPTRSVTADLGTIREELAAKVALVRHLSPSGFRPSGRSSLSDGRTATQSFRTSDARNEGSVRPLRKVIVIGASTGGPTALLELFAKFPEATGAAVVVAQHMPARFTKTFAERLDRLGSFRVEEASGSHRLEAGQAWICPGGHCIEVVPAGSDVSICVRPPTGDDRYIPSVDALFATAAKTLAERAIGVVLTGMGEDGAQGSTALKEAGGTVFAEAPETAVIYGMPAAAVRTGAVQRSLPLRDLADHLATLMT